MSRRLTLKHRVMTAAVLAAFATPGVAAPVNWITQANSFWDLATNWNPGLPGAGDDATIDVAGPRTVTLRATGSPFTINSLFVGGDDTLAITGGSLTLLGLPTADNATGASSVARLTQSGGTLAGAGSLAISGASSVTGNSVHTGSGTTTLKGTTSINGFNLDAGRTLRNEGTATLTGGMNLNATDAAGVGLIDNAAGAVFDVRTFNLSIAASNFATDGGTGARIDNSGTFRKSTTNTYVVAVSFSNLASGLIDVQLGGFSFSAGGTYAGAAALATGTSLGWSGGTHTVNAGASFTGDGTLQISGGAIVDLAAPTTIASRFTQGPGTVRGSDLTLQGATTLNNGTQTGAATTTVQGISTWNGIALDAGRVLRNEGTATVSGGVNLNATDTPGAGRIVNAVGGVIDVRTFNLSMAATNFAGDTGADASITNGGTFRKSTTGNYSVSVPFIQLATGTIDVQLGSFTFTGGGTYAGAVTLATGTSLNFGAGTHTVGAGMSFTGPGTFNLAGAGTVLDFLAATTVDSAFSMGGGTVKGADLTLNGPATLAISSSLGVMSGPATTTLKGTSTVSGGGNNPFGLDSGRVLRNEGTMSLTGVVDLNRLDTAGAGRIVNAAGALIDVKTFNQGIEATSFAGDTGADASVTNAGIFRKSTSGNYGVGVRFVNQAGGTIDVQAGSFTFTGGGSYNGAVTLAANAGLFFSGGTHSVGTGATFTGPGTLTLAGAGTVLDILAPTVIDTAFTMTGGTIQGADLTLRGPLNLTISSSLGVMAGPATTTLVGSGTFGGGANNPFGLDSGRILRNEGTMTLTGVVDMNRLSTTGSGRIVNAATGVIDVKTSNQSIFARDWSNVNPLDTGAGARIDNEGIFRKSTSGVYSIFVPFFNTGTVEILAGGFNIPTFANGGTVNVASGATFQVTGAFVNEGLIQGGGTVLAPASGLVNAGTIGPGNSPGHLTITGDLAMTSTGVIEIELNGLSDFDLLTVTGDAALAGELDVIGLPGYAPKVGDSFIIMTFNSRGATTFEQVSFKNFDEGVRFDVVYRDQDVVLNVAAVPEPETWAMLLAGLGLLGAAAGRRARTPLAGRAAQ